MACLKSNLTEKHIHVLGSAPALSSRLRQNNCLFSAPLSAHYAQLRPMCLAARERIDSSACEFNRSRKGQPWTFLRAGKQPRLWHAKFVRKVKPELHGFSPFGPFFFRASLYDQLATRESNPYFFREDTWLLTLLHLPRLCFPAKVWLSFECFPVVFLRDLCAYVSVCQSV